MVKNIIDRGMRRKCTVLALYFSLMNMSYGISQSDDYLSPGIREYQGEYVNGDYAFSVTIPPGLVGIGADYYAPDHGFKINFSKNISDSDDYIWVDGSLDVSDFDELTAQEGIRILETKRMEYELGLGGREAVHTQMKVQNPDSGETFIYTDIRTKWRAAQIRYTIGMKTSEDRYKERIEILNFMRNTFKIDRE